MWNFVLAEDKGKRLPVFKDRMLRRIFKCKRDEVTG
jgi:hypothetical protein